MVLWKQLRYISIGMPEELLSMVDEAAKKQWMSRTEYIRYVLNQEILKHHIKPKSRDYDQPGQIDPKWLDLDDS